MRARGAVLLVSCYELGHQPFNLASPLAVLGRAGYLPEAVDTSVQELEDSTIAGALLVAISVPMHTALRLGEAVARRVRRVNPSAHIAFYGLYAWLNADYLLKATRPSGQGPVQQAMPAPGAASELEAQYAGFPLADSVIGGEFEEPLLNLVRALEIGDGPAEGVRYPGEVAGPYLRHLEFAIPERSSLLGLEHYAQLVSEGTTALAGYVEATRGCKHTCLHCPITPVYEGRFFAVPRELVLQDIRQQVRAGARHITFGDPDFLNGPTHSLRILRAMHQEFPEVTFDATIKVEHILEQRDIFAELRALGCLFVVSAVESLSDEVLGKLRKGHTSSDVASAFDVMQSAGITLRPSLLAFTPWTTLRDYLELLSFVERRELVDCVDPVQYAIRLLVPPGSALLKEPETSSWLGELDERAYSFRWEHPDPRMDALWAEVSRIVGRAAIEQADACETFAAVKRAAQAAAGISATTGDVGKGAERWLSPRLTESWFCCAEPTADRVERVAY